MGHGARQWQVGHSWGDSGGGDLVFALLLEFQPQCDHILFHTHLATDPGVA